MWYRIDIFKWTTLLLPTHLRKPKIIAFLKVLITPLSSLYDKFIIDQQDDFFYLKHNAQVCYLRKALNDQFDPVNREITLSDGNRFERIYIYTRAEETPLFLTKLTLNSRDDYSDTGVDYIVGIPNNLSNQENEINALINRFNAATKRYKLVTNE
ncbi:hypothetical protein [Tenacibaculum jejuense]|nr:hypothetical protein [Tenacibaculum jejuense]